MTIVKFSGNSKAKISITGHAEYSKKGEPDIVCSAVSMLSTTLVQCLTEMEEKGYIENLHKKMKDGEVKVNFTIKSEGYYGVNILLYTIFTGFLLLQNQYPDNVKVIK